MATVPNTIDGKIQFYEDRLAVWAEDPPSIGLQATDIVSLSVLVDQARADFQAAQVSRNAAKSQTITQNNSVGAMAEVGASFIDTIRAYAKKTGNPGVYAAADIPAPQDPTPAGPPEQPTELTATLLPGGGLRLAWKGSTAQSAYFSVYRKLSSESSFTLLKSPKDKFYDDTTIPGGVNSVIYYIQAVRENYTVDSGWFQVNFGAGGASVTTIAMAA